MSPFQISVGGALLVGGLMSMGGAALNLDLFMDHPKARPFVEGLGRTGARIFYIVLGAALTVAGGLTLAWS